MPLLLTIARKILSHCFQPIPKKFIALTKTAGSSTLNATVKDLFRPRSKREQVRNELAALQPATSSKSGEIERLASYLENMGEAWKNASQEQRNRMARTLSESIRVKDGTIKGVTPQMEFTPLLVLNHFEKCQGSFRKSGSDGIRTRGLILDRDAC